MNNTLNITSEHIGQFVKLKNEFEKFEIAGVHKAGVWLVGTQKIEGMQLSITRPRADIECFWPEDRTEEYLSDKDYIKKLKKDFSHDLTEVYARTNNLLELQELSVEKFQKIDREFTHFQKALEEMCARLLTLERMTRNIPR